LIFPLRQNIDSASKPDMPYRGAQIINLMGETLMHQLFIEFVRES